jgi:hypothetical protein
MQRRTDMANRFTKDDYKVLKGLFNSMGMSRQTNTDIDAVFGTEEHKDKTFKEIVSVAWVADRLAAAAGQ